MCGIAGIVSLQGDPVDRSAVVRMAGALAHRGPDGSGIYLARGIGLGHVRLSILDPTPAGDQPMRRAGHVLVHNGEVYNYIELAAELRAAGARIRTGTDTEVVLAAYRAWGLGAVRRFNGMFAFALWDSERRRLLLARDRMGVKPLYIRRTPHSLAFASELGALVAGRPIDQADSWHPEPNLSAARDFLELGRTDHSNATFLAGVMALPAAHILVVEDGLERLARYWGPPELADDDRPSAGGADGARDERLVDEFRDALDGSIRMRLRSDVPIGTCLSGGLDSSSIVASVARLVSERAVGSDHEQMPRLGFHARFPDEGIDESAFADLVARQNGVWLIHRTPTGSPLLANVVPVLRAQGEPYGGASVNAQYAVMQAAHENGLKVLLDGQGADELLGGYLHYLGFRVVGLLRSARPHAALQELRSQVRLGTSSAERAVVAVLRASLPPWAADHVRAASRGRLGIGCAPTLRRAPRLVEEHHEPGTLLARRLWQDLLWDGLPALLRYEDRNSMAFGIEARVPFLDVRLVELAVRLPDRLRIDHGTTKAILRRAMADRLPRDVLARRDKLGFVAPQRAWLTAGRAEVGALLRQGQVVERGWVGSVEVDRVLTRGLSGGRATEQLWRLFITEAWLRLMWPDAGGARGRATWEAALASDGAAPASNPAGSADRSLGSPFGVLHGG